MVFFRQIQHLLPNARAWRTTANKQLRQFFEGLAGNSDAIRTFVDLVWSDIDPVVTRELDAWDFQFGLPANALSEADRRIRLAAAWAMTGGQSPRRIQDELQAHGFNVFVHDAWTPALLPALVYRDPSVVLSGGLVFYLNECGEALAECGEVQAEAGERSTPPGYPLVNKFSGMPTYAISLDPATFPFYFYIGGVVYGTTAGVDSLRRTEFEDLCLKLCPTQLWLGIIVEYI